MKLQLPKWTEHVKQEIYKTTFHMTGRLALSYIQLCIYKVFNRVFGHLQQNHKPLHVTHIPREIPYF